MLATQAPKMTSTAKEAPIKRQHEILAIKMIVLDTSVLLKSSWESTVAELSAMGLKVSCTSSLPYNKAMQILAKSGVAPFVDFLITESQTKRSKPSPEIFYKTCLNAGFSPKEVLVFDCSVEGAQSAQSSGCHLYKSENFSTVDIRSEIDIIDEIQGSNPLITSWQQTVQVIVPISDSDDAFIKAGFGYPAPLVEVNGRLMMQTLVENLNMKAQFVFLVSKAMYEKYNLKYFLESLVENKCKIVVPEIHPTTTCAQILACRDEINLDEPVIVTSCSQFLEWDSNAFLYSLANPVVDGGILTFQNSHPRYAYINLDNRGWVTGAELHKSISSNACAGIFHWKKAFDLFKYASIVVTKGIDSGDKFGVILAYAEAVKDGKRIKNYQCRRMWELSTPKDLDYFHMIQKKAPESDK